MKRKIQKKLGAMGLLKKNQKLLKKNQKPKDKVVMPKTKEKEWEELYGKNWN